MRNHLTPFYTIALILNFSSPKAPPLLKEFSNSSKKVVVYPFSATDPEKGASSCGHPLEKFVHPGDLEAWVNRLKHDSSVDFPVAKTLSKITFDTQFGLHSIDQVIIDVPIQGTHDSCGGDVCAALTNLDRVLQKRGGRIRIQTLTPLACHLPAKSLVVLEDASAESVAQVAERASETLAAARIKSGSKTKAENRAKIEKNRFGTLQLQGTPIQILLEQGKEKKLTLRAPISAHLQAGQWKASVISPSWLTEIPKWTLEVKSGETLVVDLDRALSNQISWVQSSPRSDLIVELDANRPEDFPARVLIPQGSGPLPMPKSIAYKVYQIK